MTAWNPYVLWDKGFRLSFAATAGLLLYAEPLEEHLVTALSRVTSADRARRMVGTVSEGLLVTIASLVTTTPLLSTARGRLSPITLVSNVLVLPAQVYVMLLGGAATILGLVVRPLGQVVAWVAWLFLTYTIEMVQLMAAIPTPSLPEVGEGGVVWIYYAGLAVGTWWLARPRERRRELLRTLREGLNTGFRPKLLFGASTVLLALAVFGWRSLPDGRLHVHVLDVGQGDAIFVETPSGRQMLVDGGPKGSVLLSRLGRRMPFWDHSLDVAALTHPDADHINGLVDVLERYQVDAVVYRDLGCRDGACQRWQELLSETGMTVLDGEAGLAIELDGVRLDLFHPGAELLGGGGFNEDSLVARLSYGEVSMLLTGDIGARAEERLLADGVDVRSTVLKVAHHGACSSNTRAFLEAVDPEVAVISVGEENDHNHPCDEVVERLEAVLGGEGERLFRTDRHGTVEVVSDGARIWVVTERER
jgi:competence protein ComEC